MNVLKLMEEYAPLTFAESRLAASIVLPGNLRVYGFVVYNTKASAQYLNGFDASELPSDNAVPAF